MQLDDNYSYEGNLIITSNVSIDLNGHILNVHNNFDQIRLYVKGTNAKLLVKDSSLKTEPTVSHTDVIYKDAGNIYGNIFVEEGGKLELESGKIYMDDSEYPTIYVYGCLEEDDEQLHSSVTISGVMFKLIRGRRFVLKEKVRLF